MATAKEIQVWTDALRLHFPEAEVMGELREDKGLLLGLRRASLQATDMATYEQMLLRAGAVGWSWNVGAHGARMRVRFGRGSRVGSLLWVIVLVLAAAAAYHAHAAGGGEHG
jgi:hypothetical protein